MNVSTIGHWSRAKARTWRRNLKKASRARVRAARKVLVFLGLAGASLVYGTAEDRIGGYNFSYDATGDTRVRPVQVFDDGRDTFFQFRAGDPVPAIFVMTSNGPVLTMPEVQGPYVRIASVSSGFLLRMGYGVGQVKYTGAGRGSVPANMLPQPTPVATAQANSAVRLLAATQQINGLPSDLFNQTPPAPRLDVNSYATPVRGDKIEWGGGPDTTSEIGLTFPVDVTKLPAKAATRIRPLAARAARAAKVEVIGRDDPSHKLGTAEARAESVAAALVAAGVPRSLITTRTTPQVKDATKNTVEGVTVRLVVRAARVEAGATPPAGGSMNTDAQVADIVRRLQAGELSPSAAVQAIERTRQIQPAVALGAAPMVAVNRAFAMRKTDENIQRMFERWGKEAGWRVVWDGGPTIPITGDAPVERPDFLQAADFVVKQAKAAGYRVRATAYSNNVLQITGE